MWLKFFFSTQMRFFIFWNCGGGNHVMGGRENICVVKEMKMLFSFFCWHFHLKWWKYWVIHEGFQKYPFGSVCWCCTCFSSRISGCYYNAHYTFIGLCSSVLRQDCHRFLGTTAFVCWYLLRARCCTRAQTLWQLFFLCGHSDNLEGNPISLSTCCQCVVSVMISCVQIYFCVLPKTFLEWYEQECCQ